MISALESAGRRTAALIDDVGLAPITAGALQQRSGIAVRKSVSMSA